MTSFERGLRRRAGERTERMWQLVARAAGGLVRVQARPIDRAEAGSRVVLVAPHPDDEVFTAATLLQHLALGAEVTIVIVTDGARSRQNGLDPATMRALRRTEAEASRDVIRPSHWHWLGLGDLEIDAQLVAAAIEPIFAERRPDLIYAPSFIDGHPDHLATAAAIARVAARYPEVRVRLYPVQIPLTPLVANLAIEGTPHRERALRAFEAHASQRSSWSRVLRMKAYSALMYGGDAWVDELWEVPATKLASLQRAAANSRFVGLREAPFRDPLAYFLGFGPRWALRRIARSPR